MVQGFKSLIRLEALNASGDKVEYYNQIEQDLNLLQLILNKKVNILKIYNQVAYLDHKESIYDCILDYNVWLHDTLNDLPEWEIECRELDDEEYLSIVRCLGFEWIDYD